jgi:serine/threonine protein kinase
VAATRAAGSRRATGKLQPGAHLDEYQILDVLGRGSMGRVYQARDPLGREVAIKMILGEVADEEGLIRFQREGQAMAAVPPHHNVVTVHSTGTWNGSPYLVLDFVQGDSLAKLLKSGPLPLERAVEVGERLCAALAHIHKSGVSHRDLKPANIMMRADTGDPVVTDFGMAGLRGADRLTRTGDLLGTPLYMAPEQILGLKDLDGRVDVWALGVLVFEMLTGRPPFTGNSLIEVTQAITGKPAPSLVETCPGADAALAEVLARALAKKPEDRYADPGELGAALAGWLTLRRSHAEEPPRPQTTHRARLVWALLVASLLLPAGLAAWWSSRRSLASSPTVTEASPARSPRTTRRSSPTPAPSQADVTAELATAKQAIDLRLARRLDKDLAALTKVVGEAGLSVEQTKPLLDAGLRWAEESLQALGEEPTIEELQTLELPLQALGTLSRFCPAALGSANLKGREIAQQTVAATRNVIKNTSEASLFAAAAGVVVALGESGLTVDPQAEDSIQLLSDTWYAWCLGHQTFPTPLYVRVLRAGVQLDIPPRLNMLYGGSFRMVDLAALDEVLGDSPLDRYLDVRFRVSLGGRIRGVAPGATLRRELLEKVVRADEPGLLPQNMALARGGGRQRAHADARAGVGALAPRPVSAARSGQ